MFGQSIIADMEENKFEIKAHRTPAQKRLVVSLYRVSDGVKIKQQTFNFGVSLPLEPVVTRNPGALPGAESFTVEVYGSGSIHASVNVDIQPSAQLDKDFLVSFTVRTFEIIQYTF